MNGSMIKIKNMKKEHQPVGEKALNRHQLKLIFKGLCRFIFRMVLLQSVNGEPIALQSPGMIEDSFGQHLIQIQPVSDTDASFSDARWPGDALLPPSFDDVIQITFIYILFQEVSTLLDFHKIPHMSLNLVCPSYIASLIHSFSPP